MAQASCPNGLAVQISFSSHSTTGYSVLGSSTGQQSLQLPPTLLSLDISSHKYVDEMTLPDSITDLTMNYFSVNRMRHGVQMTIKPTVSNEDDAGVAWEIHISSFQLGFPHRCLGSSIPNPFCSLMRISLSPCDQLPMESAPVALQWTESSSIPSLCTATPVNIFSRFPPHARIQRPSAQIQLTVTLMKRQIL